MHTVLEDQYFAWIYENKCAAAEIPQYQDRKLLTDYDDDFTTDKEGEEAAEYISVCDIILPDLEVEYDEATKDYFVLKRVLDTFNNTTKYSRVTISTLNRSQTESDSSEAEFLALRKKRQEKQIELAKTAAKENGRKDYMEKIAVKFTNAEDREAAYEERRRSTLGGKRHLESVERKIHEEEAKWKRKDMDRLKTLSGIFEEGIQTETTGKVGEKRRKVINGFTESTASFFKNMALALKMEKLHADIPRKKWENTYRLMWNLRGQEPVRQTNRRERRITQIDALNIIEIEV